MTATLSLPCIALPLLATTLIVSASAATLTIVVEDAQGCQDAVRVAIFRDTVNWLKPDSAVRVDIAASDSVSGGNMTFVYTGLPMGCYALLVFHDANSDDRLSANPADIPIKPYGLSRNARSRFGPPAFDDTVINVQGDQRVTIHPHRC